MRNLASFLVVGVLLAGSGCGDAGPAKPKLYPVSGKVTVAGKPLADCNITFKSTSTQGLGYGATVAADGSYSLAGTDGRPGAEPGKYKIVLMAPGLAMKDAMMGGAPGGGPPVVAKPFPDEYSDESTSPQEVEVKASSNSIDIVIP